MEKTRGLFGITLALITVLVGCTSQPSMTMVPTSVVTSTPQPTMTEATSSSPCILEPIVVPTRPAETPGYTQLDPDTGLHMTGMPQEIDLESYRLEVRGKVDRPLSLTYDDLRCLPKVEDKPVLACPGFFVDEATWAGVPIREVLALAGVQEGATDLDLISADGYSTQVSLTEGVSETGFLAYEWEGEPLPILHGFPVRAVLPGVSGGSWVKWLIAIEVK
jgi:DMSO/TMAO reductase YedYZ molybdopterin-dependent catalytic subunit